MKHALGIALLVLGLLVPAEASAYTLVMRNGALVDVGESYRLAGSNFEYRGRDGALRRVVLAEVDLAATARANGETVGAFVGRASRNVDPAGGRAAAARAEQAVTVTNADLEPFRAERERLDAEYRARNPYAAPPAAAVPFPAAPAPAVSNALAQWRERARALRLQIDAEQAQIDAIRDELAVREANPFDYGLSYRYNFGNAPVVRSGGGYYGYYAQPNNTYFRATEEFAQLNSRLIDLEIQHRATLSLWYNLLEDARRAGVPDGLLRY